MSREVAMMFHARCMILSLAAALVVMVPMLGTGAYAQDNRYRIEEGWGTLPDGRKWGGTIGVDIDRDGNIWVFERCGASSCVDSNLAPIIKLDPSGKVLKMFGAGMFNQPHGFHVDRDGNVWASDATGKDGKAHQVFKFNPEGNVLMTLGKAGVAGDGTDTFNRPCDVVTAPNGDIFVADGHGGDSNARIVKFLKDGKYTRRGAGRDRPRRVRHTARHYHRFSRTDLCRRPQQQPRPDLRPGRKIPRRVEAVRPAERDLHRPQRHPLRSRSQSDAKRNPGVRPGIRIGSARDGKVTAFVPALGPEEKPTSATEGIAADAAGNLYAGDTGTRNLRKYVKK